MDPTGGDHVASSSAVSGAILAGGASRRMGRDKRWIEIDGVPLLRRVVDAVRPVVDDLHVVVATATDGEDIGELVDDASVEVDRRPGEGPLAGIETALDHARHELVLVVAADHPRLSPGVLRLLIRHLAQQMDHPAAAVVTDRGPQPLLAVYRRSALPTVTAMLDGGERRATALLDELGPIRLEPDVWRGADPAGSTAHDLDTPADLDAFGAERRPRVSRRTIIQVRDGRTTPHADHLVDEEPLEIRACGPGQDPTTLVTTMRTRGHDADLAAGWLWSEGLLVAGDGTDIADITEGDPLHLARPDDQLTVHLTHPLDVDAIVRRHVAATASCGVCGRASMEELAGRTAPIAIDVPAETPIEWSVVGHLPDRLRDAQELFATTGAIHATGLFSTGGELVTLREDVGRHNALDAAIGRHVRRGEMPLDDLVCVLSGRVGFELVAKAAVAGLPVVAAVGAPSALAVRTAERLGITLVGFLRHGDGNVYTHPERLRIR